MLSCYVFEELLPQVVIKAQLNFFRDFIIILNNNVSYGKSIDLLFHTFAVKLPNIITNVTISTITLIYIFIVDVLKFCVDLLLTVTVTDYDNTKHQKMNNKDINQNDDGELFY